MPVYFDTSLLLKIYVQEPNTSAVLTLVGSLSEPIFFTDFHLAEFTNAVCCKEGRKEIVSADVKKLGLDLMEDIRKGVLVAVKPADWTGVFRRAASLSNTFAVGTLCRTLDAIHVALALELNASGLATTDKRQIALAQAAGLKVLIP